MNKAQKRNTEFELLYSKAKLAGLEAGNKHRPTPMIVGDAEDIFSNRIDYGKPTYFVADGLCGFAWVTIRPGTHPFAKWLSRTGHGRKAYYGGIEISIPEHNQSHGRKVAHAEAMAKVLDGALPGMTAYAGERLD